MGQTGRRSIATHILAVKIALAAAHFHSAGAALTGLWDSVEKRTGLFVGVSCAEAARGGSRSGYGKPQPSARASSSTVRPERLSCLTTCPRALSKNFACQFVANSYPFRQISAL